MLKSGFDRFYRGSTHTSCSLHFLRQKQRPILFSQVIFVSTWWLYFEHWFRLVALYGATIDVPAHGVHTRVMQPRALRGSQSTISSSRGRRSIGVSHTLGEQHGVYHLIHVLHDGQRHSHSQRTLDRLSFTTLPGCITALWGEKQLWLQVSCYFNDH